MPRPATEADAHSIRNLACMLSFLEPAAAVELPSTLFVSEIDANIVGFIGIDKRDTHTADLKLLYVSGGFRKSGIGRSLVVAAIDALGQGCELNVLVSKTNGPALALFKKLGFAPPPDECLVGDYMHLSLRIV
jgi:ribosomal protein S18 acetylase RimI-like enzyme